MADKLTQQILDALTRAAADSTGTLLYATKSESGLFPATAAAKPAAKKCFDDGLLALTRSDAKGKPGRELAVITEKGLQFLLAQVSPKQVLEDFVRVLELRQGQVEDLLGTAKQMADSLVGLRATVAAVLPQVMTTRLPDSRSHAGPTCGSAMRIHSSALAGDVHAMPGVATLEAPVAVADLHDDFAGAVLAHLSDWAASAGAAQDCPLPELYRSLTLREQPPTIGAFHDCLRDLHASRQIYLHPWTGPLYALPEPAYALLVGHEIAYYASTRQG